VVAGTEAGDVADLAEDAPGVDRAEPEEAGQGRVGGCHPRLDLSVDHQDPLVDGDQLGDLLGRQLAAEPSDLVARPDAGEDLLGVLGGHALGHPARKKCNQITVDPIRRLDAGRHQFVAPVGQQLQLHGQLVGADLGQPGAAQSDRGDRFGVGVVGLAAVAAGVDPGQRARRVETSKTVSPSATRR
jgi:hypothetical protein